MAETNSSIDNSFKLVTYKKPKKLHKTNLNNNNNLETLKTTTNSTTQFNLEANLKRLNDAKIELKSTDLFHSALASLREGLTILDKPIINEIYCIGLGKIGECLISRFQFAFLLCLKDVFNTQIKVYDPQFTSNDTRIIEECDCCVLKQNLEGKYLIEEESTTLFYLPHCPKQLTNNLLWTNWGLNLTHCIIISNSFNTILDHYIVSKSDCKSTEFIQLILPYTVELPIFNSFKYFEIFNDTAIHIFPLEKLRLISKDFWNSANEEPNYSDEDLEFITNK